VQLPTWAAFPTLSQADAAELKAIAASLEDRDEAIKHGVVIQGTRYEVSW
jgi:hypothetical protein